jgi:NDP-sugar pyrophosphorylase family protein
MKAMIFAAGLGTRLKPITDTIPKALVPVGGKPLLEHVALKLKAAGIDEAVVNVHHFADQVEEWISLQDIMTFNVSDERQMLLETGGAVLHAKPYLEGCGHFLIYNVDILSDVDINWFSSHVRQESLATLLVSERPSSRCLLFDRETMRLQGWMNNVTGEIRSPYDIDIEKCLKLAFSGIQVFNPAILPLMDSWEGKFSIIDFYLSVCDKVAIQGSVIDGMRILDVGKLDSIVAAEEFMKTYY